jgi:pyruvate dehydrogenase E2 component (dihydrolipoamide acetyltransferase)
MPFTLTMPKLSPTMEEGTIVKWRVREGDQVKVGDTLFEVATDKATVEHNALDEGFLRKILVHEGKSAPVNAPIAIFTEKATESIEGYQPEGIAEAKKEEAVVEVAPAKEAAPQAAKAIVSAMQQPAFVPEPPLAHYKFQTAPEGFVPASPLARKLAKEKGIDLSTISGSGPRGRVVSRDLDLGQPDTAAAFGRSAAPTVAPGTYEEEALTPMRKTVGRRLQESKTFIPHFYVVQEIDAGNLTNVREQLKAIGIKVSVNDLIVRAAALALRAHPEVNSGFNSVNATIIRFKTIDISIAVSLEAGLITPIVRHADYKDVGQISSEVRQLASRAREGKLAREEYTGGSFTISNLGMFGVSNFVAVINPPQAAILAVGGVLDKPVIKEGAIVPGKILTLTLSADHRVIDGADAAKFLATLKQYLENPAMLLI